MSPGKVRLKHELLLELRTFMKPITARTTTTNKTEIKMVSLILIAPLVNQKTKLNHNQSSPIGMVIPTKTGVLSGSVCTGWDQCVSENWSLVV